MKRFFTTIVLCLIYAVCFSQNNIVKKEIRNGMIILTKGNVQYNALGEPISCNGYECRKALLKSGDTIIVVLDTCISPTSIYHTPEGVEVPDNTIHHFLLKSENQKTRSSESNQDSHYYVNSSKGSRDSYYYVSTLQGDKMYHNGKLVYESHITQIGDNLYIDSHYYE